MRFGLIEPSVCQTNKQTRLFLFFFSVSHNCEAQLHFEESRLPPLSWVMLHPVVVGLFPITWLVNRGFCANIKTWLVVSASLFTSKNVTWSTWRLQNISISGLYKLGRDCSAETAFIHVDETSFEGRSLIDLAWTVRFFFFLDSYIQQ